MRWSNSELMAVVKDAPPDFDSGSQYAYSNTNYFLLGMIIERASGVPYQEYLEKNIFAPARLTATSVCGAASNDPRLATGYVYDGDQPTREPDIGLDAPFSSGGLCSTALVS